ncbi:MAG: PSD1 domain-containing protein [Verrucomicrobiae bacterium]|nr:PSD1 domain-containing protein [Verrucomicrobiae bacterium]
MNCHRRLRTALRTAIGLCALARVLAADEAVLFRAINLNGPGATLLGQSWEGMDTPHLVVRQGNRFENQAVLLRPPTDPVKAQMIRSSIIGSRVDLELIDVPPGNYQVFVYLWEDNHSEQIDLLINDRPFLEKAHTGKAGLWRRHGPWPAESQDGKIRISGRAPGHGAVNLSGLEVWSGTGPVPVPEGPQFVLDPSAEQIEFFERRVRPVLVDNCYECHRAGARQFGGNLLLDSRAGILRGGDTGPVITPGDPEASLLIHAIRHTDPQLTMPPRERLSPLAVADIEAWVRMGAPDPRTNDTVAVQLARESIDWDLARQWWSFQPVSDPAPPDIQDEDWPANPLDRFILARLEQAGIGPAADADRRAWIRRTTFTLTGLPPTPEEVADFLADDSPEAFAQVVDRLLASPHYGERWGRHWLDVVRYADTAGDNSDFPIPQIYRYRDWVIAAFNRDLPFDQFVREQLAGDLMPAETLDDTLDRIVATGYLANARRFGSRVEDYPQHLTIEDTLDNLGRAFLGLTVSCARCHDHKFDPITAADYYALYGIFHSTRYPWPGIELDKTQRDLVPLVPPEQRADAESLPGIRAGEQRRLEREVRRLKDRVKDTPEEEKAALEEEIKAAEKALNDHKNQPLPFELAYAVAEGARIGDVALQRRGDPALPGEVVPRRFLTVLGGTALPPGHPSSGRRELAEWIVDPANPLTARVMVNRIWLHHFGRGLVTTPNDFGKQGQAPTHPALLDWLAARFVESGWSVKAMHRLILLSRTYRQSATRDELALAKDPTLELYSGFPRRRLDAESLRDATLAISGNLDLTPHGPHPFPPQTAWNFTQHNPFRAVYDHPRRSVYLMTQRIQRHPYLAIFDGADPSASTAVRAVSTTPLQALYLLNDAFVHEQARHFAERITTGTDGDEARLRRAYELALARPPDPEELNHAREFLEAARTLLARESAATAEPETAAWQAFARVLYRLNEFAYVD